MNNQNTNNEKEIGDYIDSTSLGVIIFMHLVVVSIVLLNSGNNKWGLIVGIYLFVALVSLFIGGKANIAIFKEWPANLIFNTLIGGFIDYGLALATLYAGRFSEMLIDIANYINKANNFSTKGFCGDKRYPSLADMCEKTGAATKDADNLKDLISGAVETAPIFDMSLGHFTISFSLIYIVLTFVLSIAIAWGRVEYSNR